MLLTMLLLLLLVLLVLSLSGTVRAVNVCVYARRCLLVWRHLFHSRTYTNFTTHTHDVYTIYDISANVLLAFRELLQALVPPTIQIYIYIYISQNSEPDMLNVVTHTKNVHIYIRDIMQVFMYWLALRFPAASHIPPQHRVSVRL